MLSHPPLFGIEIDSIFLFPYFYSEAGYTSQRKFAAWIGGSIVASLETFRQMKITRQEWEENPQSCTSAKYV